MEQAGLICKERSEWAQLAKAWCLSPSLSLSLVQAVPTVNHRSDLKPSWKILWEKGISVEIHVPFCFTSNPGEGTWDHNWRQKHAFQHHLKFFVTKNKIRINLAASTNLRIRIKYQAFLGYDIMARERKLVSTQHGLYCDSNPNTAPEGFHQCREDFRQFSLLFPTFPVVSFWLSYVSYSRGFHPSPEVPLPTVSRWLSKDNQPPALVDMWIYGIFD